MYILISLVIFLASLINTFHIEYILKNIFPKLHPLPSFHTKTLMHRSEFVFQFNAEDFFLGNTPFVHVVFKTYVQDLPPGSTQCSRSKMQHTLPGDEAQKW
jgi:hypothetical protein